MGKEAYDSFSADYDRFVNWDERLRAEMPFLLKNLRFVETDKKRPIRVLDVACGTGMHAIALAEMDFQAAGADISRDMIHKAEVNAQNAGVDVEFKTAGFGELANAFTDSPDYRFDALICMGNSLPHLLTEDAITGALADMAACLRPNGVLFIQNRNFDAVLSEKQRWLGVQSHHEENAEWIFIRFYDFDMDGLITFNIIRLHRFGDAPWSQSVSSTRLLPLKQKMLLRLLTTAGFEDIVSFGGMDGSRFNTGSSSNLIMQARKG